MKHVAVAIAILFAQMAQAQVKELLESYHEATSTKPMNDEAFYLASGHAFKPYPTSIVGTSDCLGTWSTLLVVMQRDHKHLGRTVNKVVLPKSVVSMTDYEAMSVMLRLDQASVKVHDEFLVKGDTIVLCLSMKQKGSSVTLLAK
jgi:hypothetical protein